MGVGCAQRRFDEGEVWCAAGGIRGFFAPLRMTIVI
jgi:hypothetical protein